MAINKNTSGKIISLDTSVLPNAVEQKEKKNKKGPGVSDSKNDGQGVDVVPTADYKLNAAGKKYRAHRIVFNKGEDDGGKTTISGVAEQMKKSFNKFVEDHTVELTEEELDSLEHELNEVLGKDAEAGDWIHDFVHSDNPKFKGKSKEERKKQALAAYYAAQRNEELKGGQVKLDKNKNGKLDAQDFKMLRKEEAEQIDEAIYADDYTAISEKSKMTGGHRPKVVHKEKGTVMHLSQHSYKSADDAKAHANVYLKAYADRGPNAADRAAWDHVKANRDKLVNESAFDWKNTPRETSDSTKTRTYHDVKKTSTGTVYTKQFDKDGMSKGTGDDAASKAEGQKRGRGRPKKDKFSEAVELLLNLSEEQFDSIMEDGFDAFFETYENLDEVSKATLGSYIKKASRDAVITRKIAGDFEHSADRARSPSMKAASTELADKWKSKSWKRSNNINKAVDRLSK